MGSCVSSLHPTNNTSASAKIDHHMSSSSIDQTSMPPTPTKDKPLNNTTPTDSVVVVVDPPIPAFGYKSRVSPFHSLSSKRNSVSSLRSFGGSKDEAFYDTQGWLDSDCDDDFYSVNGDFTPSRGNTPVHHAAGNPRLNRVYSPNLTRAVLEGNLRSASNRSRGGTPVRRSFSSTTQDNGPITEAIDDPNTVISSSTTTTPKKSKKLLDLFRESMRERGNVGFASPLPPKSATRAPSGLRHSVSNNDNEIPVDEYVPVKDKSAKFGHRCFPRLGGSRSFIEGKRTSVPPASVDDL